MRKFTYYGSFASTAYFTDLFGIPDAAYSLRKLSPNSVYSGAAIRVRRSSDNTEQDINFVSSAVDAGIDTAALLAFVGAGNGFVVTWYNQNGSGNNATQTSGSNQPQIVSAGSVLAENSKSTILSNGTSQFLAAGSWGIVGAISRDIFITFKSLTSSNFNQIFNVGSGISGTATPAPTYGITTEYALRVQGGNQVFGSYSAAQILLNISHSGTRVFDSNLRLNQVPITRMSGSDNDLSTSDAFNYIGGARIGSNFSFNGNYQEFIIYASDKSSDRTAIENNINDYYNVF